jgi:hypothetical protein
MFDSFLNNPTSSMLVLASVVLALSCTLAVMEWRLVSIHRSNGKRGTVVEPNTTGSSVIPQQMQQPDIKPALAATVAPIATAAVAPEDVTPSTASDESSMIDDGRPPCPECGSVVWRYGGSKVKQLYRCPKCKHRFEVSKETLRGALGTAKALAPVAAMPAKAKVKAGMVVSVSKGRQA